MLEIARVPAWYSKLALDEWLAIAALSSGVSEFTAEHREELAARSKAWRLSRIVRHAPRERMRSLFRIPVGTAAADNQTAEKLRDVDNLLRSQLSGQNGDDRRTAIFVSALIATGVQGEPSSCTANRISFRSPSVEEIASLYRTARLHKRTYHSGYIEYCVSELLCRAGIEPDGSSAELMPSPFVSLLLLIRHARWDELIDVASQGLTLEANRRRLIQNRYANRHRITLRYLCLQIDAMIDDPTQDVEDIKRKCLAVAKLHYERPVQHARLTTWAKRLRERRPVP